MINELEVKIQRDYLSDDLDCEEELFLIAYLCRNEILDRMEEYGWAMASPIVVPMMSKGRLTLNFAFQQTIGRLYSIAEKLFLSDELNDILDKGDYYYKLDSSIPIHIKNIFLKK